MAKTFELDKPRSASVVGGLESYKILSISDRARTLHYDVLITSQIHGFRLGLTDSPYSLREIFLIWREVMHSIRGLRCAVKLHPSESEVDRNLIANIFFDVRERLTIEDGKSDLHSLLERSKVHSTVSSGAVVLAAKLRKRSLVYGHSKLFSDNLPEICEIFGSAAEAVALLQRDNAPGPNGHWLNDDWIENRFCELVPNMAMGRREGARWPELVGSAAVRRDARLPQGRLTDR